MNKLDLLTFYQDKNHAEYWATIYQNGAVY